MKRCAKLLSWLGALFITFGLPREAVAFSISTHELLNVKAAEQSFTDRYLKEQLGFAEGLQTQFGVRKAFEWIKFGGAAEDEFLGVEPLGAAFRSRQHFHNPLPSWDQAGLNGRCFVLVPVSGEASVRWAQDPKQGLSGQAAWADARQAFLQALALPSKAERDAAWARTFRILGQQMHLVADLAAPAHTRNDPHCRADGFETWASNLSNQSFIQGLLAAPPVRPDPTIFSLGVPIDDSIAKVPIARLWDTDQYVKTNPDITLSPTIGLAEYSNANFFSDDTVFSADLPFPARTSVELGPPEPEPKKGELRRYFKKVRDGELIDHLAVPSALYEFLPEALKDQKKGLDDKVFRDYGEKLLPRAVGYSAALLDYFFRESVQVERMYWENDGVFIDVRNRAAEEMEGVFELYAIYDKDTDGERRETFSALDGGASVKVGPHASRTFQLDVPPDHRPTPNYVLVFRGRLGDEADAVIGQIFMVPHVIVVQEDYHADLDPDCRRTDKVTTFEYEPWPGATYVRETARLACEWKAVNHALSGRILTNSRSSIIERIEARWFEGLAPLTIGERAYAGVWQREGTEPDPERFSIADPAFRDRSGLTLTIFLKGGEWIETSLATFGRSVSVHAKDLVVHNPGSGGGLGYLVESGRSVTLGVDYNWYAEGLLQYPFFQATSISGYANPTDTITYRRFHSLGLGEGVLVTPFMFVASVIDDFKTFPSGESWPSTEDPAFQAAQQDLNAIEPLMDPQTHQGPFITWQAEMARVYQPMEREFLRAVMIAEPPPFMIPLSGTQR